VTARACSPRNTLRFDPQRCVGCGDCARVCPHGVFRAGGRPVAVVRPDACMECGACVTNCRGGALAVDKGVGCAWLLLKQALLGGEQRCGGSS